MTLLVDPAALRSFAGSGVPILVAMAAVERATDLALPGLALWIATAGDGGDARLHRPGDDPAVASLPLSAPPAGLLAVVAPDAGLALPLLDALGGPPLIEAGDAAAALPALARIAVAALGAERAGTGDLHAAVATLRREAEDTRVAMLAALQGDGHRIPPPPPVLALETLPSPAGHTAILDVGHHGLGQGLGTSLEGIAAMALHVAAAPPAGTQVRVRLYGAESGRVHGSWVVPGSALPPGWIVLDLPTPIGPVRETACLDLRADTPSAGEEGRLALSLEDRAAPRDRAVVQGGVPGERALALRVWTAPFGRRFTVAPHWDWEEIEASLADSPVAAPPAVPVGVKVQLPAQIWAAAQLPAGRTERVALGAEAPRLVASLGGGERCLLVLPAVPVSGLDLLQAEVSTALGDAGLLEAALWLQPAGSGIANEADLSLSSLGARWSGWRRSGPGGAPLRLSLVLPPATVPILTAVLVLRNLGATPEDLLRVEWSELTGARLREPLAMADETAAGPFHRTRPVAASMPRLPPGEIPKVAQIRLQEHYETEDGGYRHLDILIIGLQAAGFTWPRLRFKLATSGDDPVLEFRSRPDWPPMFEAWPGRQMDEHGALLLLSLPDIGRGFLGRLRSERDRWMMLALIRLMPTAVATAAREVVSDPEEYRFWVDLARRVSTALPQDSA